MKWAAYPKYKASGVEWLGEVPEHWDILALKRIAVLRSGEMITTDRIEAEGSYPVYGGNGIRGYTTSYTHNGYYALIGRQGALCGNINYACGKFWASEHAVVVSPTKPTATKWLGELLRAMNLNQYSISAAQPGLSVEIIANLTIPIPSSSEQRAIAAFLDVQTTKIDTLIAKKRDLIDKLKEKRAALITRTVTRGLPPDAARAAGLVPNPKMKDSGVEWLGEVPEHWEVVPLQHATTCIQTGPFGSLLHQSDYVEGGTPLINPAHIVEGVLVAEDNSSVDGVTAEKLSRYRLKDGDLVFARRGEIGRCGVALPSNEGWICGTGSMVVRLKNCLPEYISNVCRSQGFSQALDLNAIGTTMKNINPTILGRMLIPLPPLAEQQAIADFLKRKITLLNKTAAKIEAAIARLQEYRSALITAAVTGKIDVREQVEARAEAVNA